MKKNYFLGAAAAFGLFALASCSNEDDPISSNQPGVEEEAAQEIILQVANTGDGLTTKAGRPLFSSEAKQDIDAVKVYFVNGGTIALTKTFNNWMSTSEDYTTGGHGKQHTWKLSAEEIASLTADEYRVYAIGYTTPDESIYNKDAYLSEYVAKTTGDWNLFKSTVEANNLGEEIFAGEIGSLKIVGGEFDLTNDPNANVLTLHRQVSGLMGYFTNVPVFAVGKQLELLATIAEGETNKDANKIVYDEIIKSAKLRLVASNRSNTIMFASFNSSFTSSDDANSEVQYVINGWQEGSLDKDARFYPREGGTFDESSKDAYEIYSINLKDWFPNGDYDLDGILGENDAVADNWVSPSNLIGAGFKPGSVFAGEFIIPFEKVANTNTLQLQLIADDYSIENSTGTLSLTKKDNQKVIRTWYINLAQDDPQLGSEGDNSHMNILDHTNGVPTALTSGEEKNNSYSLVRNHLYSVGEKGTDGYDPDTDEPEDLSKGQNLILKVNDNWEMIHKMEID